VLNGDRCYPTFRVEVEPRVLVSLETIVNPPTRFGSGGLRFVAVSTFGRSGAFTPASSM
jgi:hypothetical protein